MRYVFLVLILMTSLAYSADDWFCKDATSERGSYWIKACGSGFSLSEDSARKWALINANKEFKVLCSISATCKGRKVDAYPKRSECEYQDKNIDPATGINHPGYFCRRLVLFKIISEVDL